MKLTAPDREDHRVDRSTLIGSGGTGATSRLGAPPEVVFPAGAFVHEGAVDVHLDDIVALPVNEIHRERNGVGLFAVEAARDHCLDEVVLQSAAVGSGGR